MSRLSDLLREGATEVGGQLDAAGQLGLGIVKQPIAGLAGASQGLWDLATGKGKDVALQNAAQRVNDIQDWGGPLTERGGQRLQDLGTSMKGVEDWGSKLPGVAQASNAWDTYAQAHPAPAATMAGVLAAVNPVKGEGAAAGAAERAAARAAEGRAMQGYLPHTPLDPHPAVGSRYTALDLGGMAPKAPLTIEDMKGSNLVAMPWDMSSRNRLVTNISGNELPTPTLTTGGQDWARDLGNMSRDIGGASNLSIAKRIQDRNAAAAREGLEAGGSGKVYMMPSTMGQDAEFFSTMPTDALMQLFHHADLGPQHVRALNQMIRNAPLQTTTGGLVRPFGGFLGLDHPEVQQQLLTGHGIDTTPGNLRTAMSQQLTKVGPQQMLGFNKADLMNAITDPALAGVGKGHVGNTVIEALEGTPLSPSEHPAYDTSFAGRYAGSLGHNVPIEAMMPKTYERLFQEMQGRPGNTRNMVIGAMEKRGSGFSEPVDQRTIDSVNQWIEQAQRAKQLGAY
jgi:hypothetical protein